MVGLNTIMDVTSRNRTALAIAATLAVAATILLAGCAGGEPPAGSADPGSTPSAGAPSGATAADLDCPLFYEESMLDTWDGLRTSIADQTTAWQADCTVESTDDPAGDCNAALFELLRTVNGLKQAWLAFDNSDWDSGEFSGLIALDPTRDATTVASTSGSAWSGSCTTVAGNPACADLVDAFVADLDGLNASFAQWRR
jgi:hypothetical protein